MQPDTISILDKIKDSIVVFDKDGNISYVNEAFAEIVGLEKPQMLTKNIWSLRPRLVGTTIYLSIIESMEKKEVRIVDWKSPYSDRFWESKIFPSEKGVTIVGRDVTERKKYEETLENAQKQADASRKRLETILELSPSAVVILDAPDGKFSYANKRAVQLYGFDTLGLNLAENVSKVKARRADGSDYPIEKMPVSRTLKFGEEVRNEEMIIERPDGTAFPILTSTAPLFDVKGKVNAAIVIFENVTERKKVEKDLKMASAAYDLSSDSIIVSDLDGNILRFNDAACKMRGYTREEMAKLKVKDLNAPESAELLESRFKHLVEKGSAFFEAYHVRKDKSLIPVEIHASSVEWENKKLIVAIHRDVTERKKAEESLRESEKLYRTLFDNSEDGFMLLEIIFDKNGAAYDFRFLKLNAAYEQQTSAKAEDILGKLASEVTPYLEPEITLLSGDVSRTGKSIHKEAFNKYSNKWFDSYYFSYSEGKVGILFRDITNRKKAEEALIESEQNFQNLFEQSPISFEIHDKDGLLINANSAWEKLWQIQKNAVIGKWNILESEQIKKQGILPYIKRAYNGENVAIPENEFDAALEPELYGKGTKRLLSTRVYPIKNGNGKVAGIVVMHEDITDRKNLEKRLQENERMAAIGQTAGMIGHDIRNPLQAIVGELHITRSVIEEAPNRPDREGALESVNFIQAQVDYINKIVSDLQDYARPIVPEYSIADLSDVFVHVFETISVPESINLSINVKKAEKIKLDPSLLQRAVTNLVNNAIQAMPEGGKLELCGEGTDSKIVITVSDTGIGIPDEVKPKLFTPMMTTKSKGQGFGLAVSKRITEAMKGTISFKSEKGKGTKFIIELPLS